MPNEIGEHQICNFPSQSHGGGIKKKIDSVNSDNTNKVSEIKLVYTPSTQSKLKTTISIHTDTSTPVTSHSSINTSVIKQENPTTQNVQKTINQSPAAGVKTLTVEDAQKAFRQFGEQLAPSIARDILIGNPLEVRGKDQVTLFINHTEQENAILQMKNDLVVFLQQYFNNHHLQFSLRKPYTDSEKLHFLKSKYEQVNELVNKLGLDLI